MKQKLITVALFGAITLPFAAYAETPMELVIVTPTRFLAAPVAIKLNLKPDE